MITDQEVYDEEVATKWAERWGLEPLRRGNHGAVYFCDPRKPRAVLPALEESTAHELYEDVRKLLDHGGQSVLCMRALLDAVRPGADRDQLLFHALERALQARFFGWDIGYIEEPSEDH